MTSTPTTPTPTPPSPTVTSVRVTAPASTAKPGESAQFTATAVMSNSTTQTITIKRAGSPQTPAWRPYPRPVLSPRLRPVKSTSALRIRASRAVPMSPSPRRRRRLLSAALSGSKERQRPCRARRFGLKDTAFSTNSDSAGHYCFSGIANGRFMLRATKSGYELTEQDVTINGSVTADIAMVVEPGPKPSALSISNSISNPFTWPERVHVFSLVNSTYGHLHQQRKAPRDRCLRRRRIQLLTKPLRHVFNPWRCEMLGLPGRAL